MNPMESQVRTRTTVITLLIVLLAVVAGYVIYLVMQTRNFVDSPAFALGMTSPADAAASIFGVVLPRDAIVVADESKSDQVFAGGMILRVIEVPNPSATAGPDVCALSESGWEKSDGMSSGVMRKYFDVAQPYCAAQYHGNATGKVIVQQGGRYLFYYYW